MAVFRVEKTKDFVDLFLTQARLDYTKEHGEKSLDPRKYETEYRADGSRTYTNKTERAGTVKNFQIRTKQILSLLLRAVQKTIISKSAQNHCNFSYFAL